MKKKIFYKEEKNDFKDSYINYLKITGSLSRLFSDSLSPYLYYRAAENIFCLAFEADNLSRSDVAIDAKKYKIGFGLKTFLHGNGKTLQKVAEFNAIRNEYTNLSDEELIKFIAEARNKRLDLVINSYGLEKLVYHCLTRSDNNISVYEFPMDKVDLESIKDIQRKGNTIQFKDSKNEYSFNLSKSTLYKRFICDKSLENIHVDILGEPYSSLSSLQNIDQNVVKKSKAMPFIYLPLYAPSSKELEPALASGINQWNAGGRERNENELYIPVPAWIHKKYKGFFPDNNDDKFELKLPNGEIIDAKMCQSGQKGLMSNPNKALGKWILRDVLKMEPRTLINRAYLDKIGIDSVIVYKTEDSNYEIDFASLGKFEDFKSEFEFSIEKEETPALDHDNKIFTVENKKKFDTSSQFKTGTLKAVFEFAYEESYEVFTPSYEFENVGESNGERFIDIFLSKLADLAFYNEFFKINKEAYGNLDLPSLDYGLININDIKLNDRINFKIFKTKFYSNLLLVNTKKCTKNGLIKNEVLNNERTIYDYIVLTRISPSGRSLIRDYGLLYSNEVNKEKLWSLINDNEWKYDIPGYITNEDLKSIIKEKQMIPKEYSVNGRLILEEDMYYEQTGSLKDFGELVKSFK